MNTEEKIELSIVMPVFNRKDLVRVMIDSIIANTYQNWELLAIDDGSTDGAYEMMLEYASRDNRVKPHLRTKLPKGAQTCRNYGLELAKGEYIIFFDSDDYIVSSCLQKRINEMKKRSDIDFLVFPAGIYENQERGQNMLWGREYRKKKDLSFFLARELPFIVCTNIYKRESLLSIKVDWDVKIQSLQDSQFNIHVLLKGLKYDYIKLDSADYLYRCEGVGDSIAKKINGLKHAESHLYVLDDTYKKVTEKYGDIYNKALFAGALFLAHRLTTNSYDKRVMQDLLSIVMKYDKRRARELSVVLFMYERLLTVLPNIVIHRLLFLPNTLMRRWHKFYRQKNVGRCGK